MIRSLYILVCEARWNRDRRRRIAKMREKERTAITARIEIPTIGIGAGPSCDGQVLVWHDLLGLYAGPTPRFVKRYAELAGEIASALESYVADVRGGAFPESQHSYTISDDELAGFELALAGRAGD